MDEGTYILRGSKIDSQASWETGLVRMLQICVFLNFEVFIKETQIKRGKVFTIIFNTILQSSKEKFCLGKFALVGEVSPGLTIN